MYTEVAYAIWTDQNYRPSPEELLIRYVQKTQSHLNSTYDWFDLEKSIRSLRGKG